MSESKLWKANSDVTNRVAPETSSDIREVGYRFEDDELDWKEMYESALFLAVRKHEGQTYGGKEKEPYINHPIRVSFRCNSKQAKIVALLHDIVEDTNMTIAKLIERGFPRFVCDAVDAMTHREDEDYFDYVRRAIKNPIAKEVKIADLKENMGSIVKLRSEGNNKWADKLQKKYDKALLIIES